MDALRTQGIDVEPIRQEILSLKRQIREGGQLREGDWLSDQHYLLLRIMGRGGYGVVWEALEQKTGAKVAIKVLLTDSARDPRQRERFFRGAREMAKLKHEAVVRVLEERGEDTGYFFFVMELIEGGDLR